MRRPRTDPSFRAAVEARRPERRACGHEWTDARPGRGDCKTCHSEGVARRWALKRADNLPAVRAQKSLWQAGRRARQAAAFVETVWPLVVYERGKGVCGICSQPVAIDSFEVDHIKPLARGGEHSYANTQPAHVSCNRKKWASWS